jgi:hypothetical protein
MDPFRYNEDDPNPLFDDDSEGWFARNMSEAEAAQPNMARFILWALLGGICLLLTLRIALGPAMERGLQSEATDLGIGLGMALSSFGAWWSLRTAKHLTTVAWLRRALGLISVLALLYGCLIIYAVTGG